MSPDGTPCWIDLATDGPRARAFYAAVLGWTYTSLGPEFGDWQLAHVGGAPVAAIGSGEREGGWQVFLRTQDVNATVAAAVALGAEVPLAPGDVGDLGRAAQVASSDCPTVGLWQAGSHEGFGVTGAAGEPVWFEAHATSASGAAGLLAELFGLTTQALTGFPYVTLLSGGRPWCGVLEVAEPSETGWRVYFAVSDVDVAVARVAEAGGTVVSAPRDTPHGRLAVCRDPMGAVFSLLTP